MARMLGVEKQKAGLLTRGIFWMVPRKLKKLAGKAVLVEPIRITAHHPRLLLAVGQMEMGQEAARTLPAALKTLVGVKVAMMIGCPF